jgi:hypothetical protein
MLDARGLCGPERLLENLFRRHGEAVGDVCRAVGYFQQTLAERASELARFSRPGREFDPAEAGVTFGTDDVAFSHRLIMPVVRNRSTTALPSSRNS